jgi:predicted Zn-dependent protease
MKWCILATLLLFNLLAQGQKKSLSQSMGEKTFEMVKKTYGIYDNPMLLSEVKTIGRRLEKHLPFQDSMKYFLVDTYEPNAFATEGGYVYVTRGLLSIITSKDELACIMAHEISHVTKKHPRKTLEVRILPAIMQIPGNVLGALTSPVYGKLFNDNINKESELFISAFSRSQEKAADIEGVKLASKAGFNPYGLVSGLQNLTDYILYFDSTFSNKNIYNDHPITDTRAKYIEKYLIKNKIPFNKNYTIGTNLFAVEGMYYGYDPKYGVLNKNNFAHPIYNIAMTLPSTWRADISFNSLSAISKDNNSFLYQEIDTSNKSIDSMLYAVRNKFNNSGYIIDSFSLNGLKVYSIKNKMAISELFYTIYFIQLPNRKEKIKVIAGYKMLPISNELLETLKSYRVMNDSERSTYFYRDIHLVDIDKNQSLATYIAPYQLSSSEDDLVYILNRVDDQPIQPTTEVKLKIIRKTTLQNFK